MPNENNGIFHDKNIQRFDAETIRNRYGTSWKSFASNVREVVQPDGSIIKEYVIEDPSLLEQIQESSQPVNSAFSHRSADGEQQQSVKNRIAQLKATFEQRTVSNVMASPMTPTTISSGHTSATHNSSRNEMDNLHAKQRRASNESISVHGVNNNNKNPSYQSVETQNGYNHSQSLTSEKSKQSSFRRFDSADEADEEVRKIHQQGRQTRRQYPKVVSTSSSHNTNQNQAHIQYEVVDEDGNPLSTNGIQDLIKTSGVRAQEIPQPDGTILKEYVIDDPELVSKFRSQQQQQQQSTSSSYSQQQWMKQDDPPPPPPPPRIPLRPSILFRPGGLSTSDNPTYNIQHIQILEPQRRYEYTTRTGRRVEFLISNSDNFNTQILNDSEIRELTNAINSRSLSSSVSTIQQQQQQQLPIQASFNQPKPWYPTVDLTHRQRIGSDSQSYPNNNAQQKQADLPRSTSSSTLNHNSYALQNHQQVFNEPVNGWNTYQYLDTYGERTNKHPQYKKPLQTTTQLLPAQQEKQSANFSRTNNNDAPGFHQQSSTYPYQGQEQHGVRILTDFNHQLTDSIADYRSGI